jgi:hypothetical protein
MGERIEIRRAEMQAVEELPLDGARIVTASALLDLVSAAWIGRLADRLAADRLGFYAALSYDGSTAWEPARNEDRAVLAAFNEDQRSDKGFGPALGPDAAPALARAMADRGYRVETAPSAWRLGPVHRTLQASLAEGIAAAAARAGSAEAEAWGQARRAEAMAGLSSCTVGHVDVLALPT